MSGALTRATELGQLEAAGIRRLVDMRGDDEGRAALEQWAAANGVSYAHEPIGVGGMARVVEEALAAPDEASGRDFQRRIYFHMVDAFAPRIARTLALIAEPGPVGFGCAAGKDRTGIVTALLHALLGVSEAEAAATYARLAPSPDQLRPLAVEHGLDPDADMPPGLVAMLDAPQQLMLDVFARVRERHGSLDAYLRDAGFPDDGAGRLRARLIA